MNYAFARDKLKLAVFQALPQTFNMKQNYVFIDGVYTVPNSSLQMAELDCSTPEKTDSGVSEYLSPSAK